MRGLLRIFALEPALLVAVAVGASAATVQVNGSTGTANVTAPRSAEVRWNVGDVNKANGVFLFVSKDQADLQTRAAACAQGDDAALQNLGSAAGQPGTGFAKGDEGSRRVSLPKGTWYVLGCAVEEEDGQLSNRGGATNIVQVAVGDDRPSRGDAAGKASPQFEAFTVASPPDLEIVRYRVNGRRSRTDYWVWFDPSGEALPLVRCRAAEVVVYNGGGSTSGQTDVMVTTRDGNKAPSFRAELGPIEPNDCVAVRVDLQDTSCDSAGVAAVDASKRVAESDEGNNLSKENRYGRCPEGSRPPHTPRGSREDHRKKRKDHRR